MNRNLQELLYAGSDILKSVSNAVDRGDYSRLASEINQVVRSVNVTQQSAANYGRPGRGKVVDARPDTARNNAVYGDQKGVQITYNRPGREDPNRQYFLQKKVSRSIGIPQMIIGGIFGIVSAIIALVNVIAGSAIGAIFFGLITAGCGTMIFRGNLLNTLAQKYYQYGGLLGNAEYFDINYLASRVFKTDKEVLKDIKQMIKEGFLPRARLDEKNHTCMITDNAYGLYLGAIQDREQRVIAEQQQAAAQKAAAAASRKAKQGPDPYKDYPEDVRALLHEGSDYIAFVRHINDIIPDTEEMSNKLYRLEDIMNRIFAQVKKDPDSADELGKLMTYYLPTTKKLLNAYVELDKQPGTVENIAKTKREIDDAMDTINEAFENLLNSMFQDMAWDISSDISVMKTMMAQDGLTEDGSINKQS